MGMAFEAAFDDGSHSFPWCGIFFEARQYVEWNVAVWAIHASLAPFASGLAHYTVLIVPGFSVFIDEVVFVESVARYAGWDRHNFATECLIFN